MRGIYTVTATALVALGLAACGGGSKEKKETAGTAATATETATTSTGDGKGLPFKALELGAYLADDLAGAGGTQVAVEYGYVDVRQERNGSKTDIFDFRWKQIGVLVGAGVLPAKKAAGCEEVSTPKGSPDTADSVAFAGPAAKTVTPGADGYARLDVKDDKTAFDVAKTLTATVSKGGAAVATVQPLAAPKIGAIQLAGAYDTNLSVNTMVKDVNAALGKSTDDLLLGDVGTGDGYDLVVVTLYGGADAEIPHMRCVFPKGGSATLPKATYAKLLPLKGLTGHFAKLQVETAGGVTTWAAAIVGQGAEDLAIP